MSRPKTVQVRVNSAEQDGIRMLVERLNVSTPSEAVRLVLRQAMQEHGISLVRRQPPRNEARGDLDDKL